MIYRITGVSTVVKDKPDGKFGPAKVYRISVEGVEGPIDLFQAASSTPPEVGDTLEGSVEKNDYGQYFKRTRKSFNPPRSSGSNSSRGPNIDAMLISYAKDLLIAYMNSKDWDATKFKKEDLLNYARVIVETSKALLDDETTTYTTPEKSSSKLDLDEFGIADIEKSLDASDREKWDLGLD